MEIDDQILPEDITQDTLINKIHQGIVKQKKFNLNRQHIQNRQKKENLEMIEAQLKLIQEVSAQLNEIIENIGISKFSQHEKQALLYQRKNLLIRQRQLYMILFLIENQDSKQLAETYKKSFEILDKFKISIENIKKPINHYLINQLFERQSKCMKQLIKNYKQIIKLITPKNQEVTKKCIVFVKNCSIIISKIATIIQIFPHSAIKTVQDLFGHQSIGCSKWKTLNAETYNLRVLADKMSIKKSFDQVKARLNIVNSVMSHKNNIIQEKENKDSDSVKKIIQYRLSILKNLLSKKSAQKDAQIMISNPDKILAKQIWNIYSKPTLKNIVQLALPKIQYSKVIFVPCHFERITAATILKYTKQKNFGINKENYKMPQLKIQNKDLYTKTLFEAKSSTNNPRVQITVNSPFKLFNVNQLKQKKQAYTDIESIIFHIHGGGFISMSPHVHQMYSRIWAKNLNVPIFSVNYGKAPEFPYPCGLDDCFQGYMWLLNYLQHCFNIKPKKIVLVGDSAGGNLVAALTSLLIKLKLRIPDGIVLCYPALNLNYNFYTPSLLNSLDCLILPHTFLKICLESYILPGFKPEEDPFLSPIRSSDQILMRYPPTKIYIGNSDPFHDDCCRLAQRLMLLNKSVKLYVYDNFPHGFLQFDDPEILYNLPRLTTNYCHIAIKEVEEGLKELLFN